MQVICTSSPAAVYHRAPLLGSPQRRTLFVRLLEQTRQRYGFVVVGYVVMPEHFHVLISEPETGTPATVMQVLKQRFAQHVLHAQRQRGSTSQGLLWEPEPRHIWQERFYDFNVWSQGKRVEKLHYMHRNPVERRLVLEPQQWRWSSFRHYAQDERGPVLANQQQKAELHRRKVA